MKVIDNTRPDRQLVMFSATFPRSMEALARKILQKPIEIDFSMCGCKTLYRAEVLTPISSFWLPWQWRSIQASPSHHCNIFGLLTWGACLISKNHAATFAVSMRMGLEGRILREKMHAINQCKICFFKSSFVFSWNPLCPGRSSRIHLIAPVSAVKANAPYTTILTTSDLFLYFPRLSA